MSNWVPFSYSRYGVGKTYATPVEWRKHVVQLAYRGCHPSLVLDATASRVVRHHDRDNITIRRYDDPSTGWRPSFSSRDKPPDPESTITLARWAAEQGMADELAASFEDVLVNPQVQQLIELALEVREEVRADPSKVVGSSIDRKKMAERLGIFNLTFWVQVEFERQIKAHLDDDFRIFVEEDDHDSEDPYRISIIRTKLPPGIIW